MPSTRSIRCTTLAPTAMRTRSHEPTALGFAPSHGPTGEGPASGFVGRAIVSPAYVARGHRLDLVSVVTGLVGYPFAFRMRRRRWHRYSMSSNRLRRATDTDLLDSASTQVGEPIRLGKPLLAQGSAPGRYAGHHARKWWV